jgi:hypothetical protein
MNRPDTSESGNVHGMPLAALLGPEPAELARIGGDQPSVLARNTVLVGIRNLDEVEKKLVRASNVHVFTMKEVDRMGIAQVMERALALASDGTGGIHVSFDMDVCDPAIAPGVGTPVKGGLDYREAHMVTEMLADSGLLRAPRSRRGQSHPRRSQHDRRARRGTGRLRPGAEDYLTETDSLSFYNVRVLTGRRAVQVASRYSPRLNEPDIVSPLTAPVNR